MATTEEVTRVAVQFATLVDELAEPPVAVFCYVDGKAYRVEATKLFTAWEAGTKPAYVT